VEVVRVLTLDALYPADRGYGEFPRRPLLGSSVNRGTLSRANTFLLGPR
jgi:hypothetical protein